MTLCLIDTAIVDGEVGIVSNHQDVSEDGAWPAEQGAEGLARELSTSI